MRQSFTVSTLKCNPEYLDLGHMKDVILPRSSLYINKTREHTRSVVKTKPLSFRILTYYLLPKRVLGILNDPYHPLYSVLVFMGTITLHTLFTVDSISSVLRTRKSSSRILSEGPLTSSI